ncbi:hypothetical protein [Sedimentisphaera salicampi]|uniref:6-phosphofructokinase n=1 Tax=Sedimentisphaera salicampi TaxID=1941349 RepID=A0A1W6LLM9_9BACT|nr:hypothetical protein [Sedimentisphaera salicampi]ARN56698.1 6-phosphofructokinase [Sedimentisphaera salicampi]
MIKGNAIIGKSGSPTSVINASLSGVIENALKSKNIDNFSLIGVLKGYI